MADALWSGRKFRTFSVTDEYKREALRIEIDTRLPAARGDPGLERTGGYPWCIPVHSPDNGPEFIAKALADQAASKGIGLNHIQPGKPTQKNAYLERFNKTYRTEVLDCYVFELLQEVGDMAQDWLQRYNHHRPQASWGRWWLSAA